MSHQLVLAAIIDLIRGVVREELAAGDSDGHYSADRLPPRVTSVRAFNRRCRVLDGAVKESGRWIISREHWHRGVTSASTKPMERASDETGKPAEIDDAAIDAMIASAGYRLTKAAR